MVDYYDDVELGFAADASPLADLRFPGVALCD